ncbi:MAG: hypothetical protein R2932_07000 [Caldilineaceae bacterium]
MSLPTYATLEIRIQARDERGYPVVLTLPGEQEFEGGYLSADFATSEEIYWRLRHLDMTTTL